jgi:hypothetical protein
VRTTLIKSLLLHTPSPHRSCDKIVFTRRMKNIKRYREKSSYTEKTERYWIRILYLYKPSVRAKYIILYRRLVPSSLFLSQTRQYIYAFVPFDFYLFVSSPCPGFGFQLYAMRGSQNKYGAPVSHFARRNYTRFYCLSLFPQKHSRL